MAASVNPVGVGLLDGLGVAGADVGLAGFAPPGLAGPAVQAASATAQSATASSDDRPLRAAHP